MAKPSGKSKGATSSEKNAGKNVLLTAEEHATRKRDSRANKKRGSSGLGHAGGNLAAHLAYKSYANAQVAVNADKSNASREASAKIAGARVYSSRSV